MDFDPNKNPNIWYVNPHVGIVETKSQAKKKKAYGPNNTQGKETSKVSSEPNIFHKYYKVFRELIQLMFLKWLNKLTILLELQVNLLNKTKSHKKVFQHGHIVTIQ